MFLLRFVKPVRDLLRIFSSENSARQLAMGVALGMAIGLLPKGNLIAFGLTVVMLTLRVNLGTGFLTAFAVSLMAGLLDPLTHRIGTRILSQPVLYQQLAGWYELPIVPWTALNNTVVIGATVLGATLFYPTFHLSEKAFHLLIERRRRSQVASPGPTEASSE